MVRLTHCYSHKIWKTKHKKPGHTSSVAFLQRSPKQIQFSGGKKVDNACNKLEFCWEKMWNNGFQIGVYLDMCIPLESTKWFISTGILPKLGYKQHGFFYHWPTGMRLQLGCASNWAWIYPGVAIVFWNNGLPRCSMVLEYLPTFTAKITQSCR